MRMVDVPPLLFSRDLDSRAVKPDKSCSHFTFYFVRGLFVFKVVSDLDLAAKNERKNKNLSIVLDLLNLFSPPTNHL